MTLPIRRALISAWDKTGVIEFARALAKEFGVEILSTGGTARELSQAGIPVTMVEQVTDFPEMLDGRVKTLHPHIHAGILADRDNPEHMRQLAAHAIRPIDLVVVNLYPFERTIAKPDCTPAEAIEMIDIGGPCLLRAAAKNHRHVLVAGCARHYDEILELLRGAAAGRPIPMETRTKLAAAAFTATSGYDAEVFGWFNRQSAASGSAASDTGATRALRLVSRGELRYGENPHQKAEVLAWRREAGEGLDLTAAYEPGGAGSVALSYNNYLDADAAMQLCADLSRESAAIGSSGAHRFSTGDQPGGSPFEPVHAKQWTHRDLPHLQSPGETYFVTFRLANRTLNDAERDTVLSAARHWHGVKVTLHAAVVMPDHVHLLLTPHNVDEGVSVSLAELMHSIKRHSAQEINRSRGETGPLWQREYFDRLIRNEAEFAEKWNYMEANPVKAGIAKAGEYRWFWRSRTGWREQIRDQERDRLESGSIIHRLKTGAEHQLLSAATGQGAGRAATCCFIKHTNPCGVGVHVDPVEAYRRAYLGDPNAAMGGVLAVDFQVTSAIADAVMETLPRWGKAAGASAFFVEVWIAPGFDAEAVQVIRTRRPWGEKTRLLHVGEIRRPATSGQQLYRSIAGGLLEQTPDMAALNEESWRVVTNRAPGEREMADLRLAWLITKHTRSNAISLCRDGLLIGNGAGQMSRVMSCRIATWLAKENGHAGRLAGAAAASDAFFPFRDGPELLLAAGVTALIQPGGGKRDTDTIAACDERGAAMVLTGTRHFRH